MSGPVTKGKMIGDTSIIAVDCSALCLVFRFHLGNLDDNAAIDKLICGDNGMIVHACVWLAMSLNVVVRAFVAAVLSGLQSIGG